VTPLAGKSVLVTGASRGIGRAIAVACGRAGAAVIVNYRSDDASASAAVGEIEAAGAHAIAIKADIADRQAVAGLFDGAERAFGALDVLIANAAQYARAPISETSEADFDAVFRVNARGTFFCLQEASRRIADGGSIVVISASGVGGASLEQSVYHASKAAEEHFVRVLAREIGHRGVRVNSLAPGPTRTDMFETASTEVVNESANRTDLGRLGEVDDIADVAVFLAGPSARWVTGQNIRANGGFHPF
jgi:3-oxoacyl-[acyl-carrier protein] reductase